jgi:hypothetical protein
MDAAQSVHGHLTVRGHSLESHLPLLGCHVLFGLVFQIYRQHSAHKGGEKQPGHLRVDGLELYPIRICLWQILPSQIPAQTFAVLNNIWHLRFDHL